MALTPKQRLACLSAAKSLSVGDTAKEEAALAQRVIAWAEAQTDTDAALEVVTFLGTEAASPLKGDGPLLKLDELYTFAMNPTPQVRNTPAPESTDDDGAPRRRLGRKAK